MSTEGHGGRQRREGDCRLLLRWEWMQSVRLTHGDSDGSFCESGVGSHKQGGQLWSNRTQQWTTHTSRTTNKIKMSSSVLSLTRVHVRTRSGRGLHQSCLSPPGAVYACVRADHCPANPNRGRAASRRPR